MKYKLFLLGFILAFITGWFTFKLSILHVALDSAPTPWIILTLLLFSSGYCVQAMLKIPEANEHPSLTSTELRRLRPVIRVKKNRLTFILCYHILSGIIVSLGFFTIKTSNYFFPVFFCFSGAMVFSSLYTFFFIRSNIDEVQKFKSILIHRAELEKRKQEMLDSLKKSPINRAS